MMKKEEDWVSSALTDDTVVAELLFRLKHHHPSSPAKGCGLLYLTLPANGWGHRKPRSKPPYSTSIKKDKEKEKELVTATTTTTTTTTRFSPTTPLSWSDGGYDESSRQPSSDLSSGFRSKGAFTNETSNGSSSSSSRRSRKKKTFSQLKEVENLLLKERVHLKRELATLHVTLGEQRARSENLKRIKIDLNLQSTNDMAVSNQCNLLGTSRTDHAHSVVMSRHTMDSCRAEKPAETQRRGFVLPDLNMMPPEEEIGTQWN